MILGQYTTVQAIRNILVKEMSYLMAPNRFLIFNQEFKLPPDQNAWVVVKHSMSKVYSNQNLVFIDKNDDFVEEQDLYSQDVIIVTIMSKNLQALQFNQGIPMALRSIYSQQQQEKYTFKLPMTMIMNELSEVEGGSMYYRFDWTLNVLTWYQLIKPQQYLDVFTTQVRVNDGQPDLVKTFNPAILP